MQAPATRLRSVLTAFLLTLGAANAQAPGDVRIALVIGNGAYAGPAALVNPANDAKAMSQALGRLGFEVHEVLDGGHLAMQQAIEKVRAGLKGRQAIGMFYYAGHGLQVDWRNYMVPVDAQPATGADVQSAAIDVGQVIDAFRTAGTRMNILVLDACRDNPFAGKATGKGLAPVDAPSGTFLAYATAPGNVALDGDAAAGNSLYTAALVQELQKPAARIEDIFKRVRLQVRQKTAGKQIPWESTSLEEDFVFHTGKLLPVARPDERGREQAFAQQKAEWERIKATATVDDLYAFLQKHPQGSFSELAQGRLEALQQAQVKAQPLPDTKEQGNFLDRYREGDRVTLVTRDGLTGTVLDRSVLEIRMRGQDEFEGVNLEGTRWAARGVRGGFVSQDNGGTYDPPWSAVPGGELQVGKRASGRSIVTRRSGVVEWIDIDTRIVAREKLQTEALGVLDTYRVEVTLLAQSGQRGHITFWYEPDWGYAVRTRVEFRRGGAPDIQLREMVARTRKS